jgi:nitrite reductase/ring-hydroxylating ferredoxin subunit
MQRLCALADIADNDARGFRTPKGEVIVARQGLAVYGYLNRCPHIGIGLNFQPDVFMDLTQRYLLCANHGALFRVEDGFCLRGPCHGQSLKSVQLVIEKSIVWLIDE